MNIVRIMLKIRNTKSLRFKLKYKGSVIKMAKEKVKKSEEIEISEDDLIIDDEEEVGGSSSSAGGDSDEFRDKHVLSSMLLAIMKRWRTDDLKELIAEAKEIGYDMNFDELMMLTDFVVPTHIASIVGRLETAVASWMRLGLFSVDISDIELGAKNDLEKKAAESMPSVEEKKTKGYTEVDRSNVVELETVSAKEYLRKVKKVRMKISLLVGCVKEYINVAKKLVDYHTNKPGGGSDRYDN